MPLEEDKIKQYVIPEYRKKRMFYHAQSSFIHAREYFYNLVKKEKPASILDVGCGTGLDFNAITKLGVKYVGVDPIEDNIEQARKDHPKGDFKVGFVQELPFLDKSFDWVWMAGVWEILPTVGDMRVGIEECMRVARIKVFNLDCTAKPRLMQERYMMIPMEYGLSITRVNYNPEKHKADYLWCIDKEGIK